jgi:hypothetical protein
MTALYGQPSHFVGDNSQVGVQGQNITVEGSVHVGGPGESPEAEYAAGVASLNSRNPERARELIWEAMTGRGATGNEYVTSEVLFYWLVAMLSGGPSGSSPKRRSASCATFGPGMPPPEATSRQPTFGSSTSFSIRCSGLPEPGGCGSAHLCSW